MVGILRFKISWLANKNSLKHHENNLNQLKATSANSPRAYIREGLLSEGYLRLKFGGLIFGRPFYLFIFIYLLLLLFIYFFFLGGGIIIGILQ